MKVLLITNIPNPYRIPLFNELHKQLNEQGIKLKVLFGALGYLRRKWEIDMSECEFDYETLPSRSFNYGNIENTGFTYSGLYRLIKRENPLVIITNSFSIATMKLWWRSWFRANPYIIWSGSINIKGIRDSVLRRFQRQILTKRAAGFIAYGTKAGEYLVSLGAAPSKVQIGVNTVDTNFYQNETQKIRNKERGTSEKRHLLYIGYLTQGKRIDHLFFAVRLLLKRRQDFNLLLVGDGAEMQNLISLANDLKITDCVSFEGFKQKNDIPKYLAQADCFLFPSEYDIWGLVLVEAMAVGLPCISSIHAGATHDLIQDGITGFAIDFSETEKLAEKINWILDNPEASRKIGHNASRFIAENVTLEKSATGFVKAIKEVR